MFVTFFVGYCEKQLGNLDEAISKFETVLEHEGKLIDNKHLVAQSCYEIGLIKRQHGQLDDAIKWLKRAKNYGHHFTEIMIKYKSQLTIDAIKKQSAN